MDALNERSLGRGTSAARRCMNSSGDITICVVPYLDRGLQVSTPCPARLSVRRSVLRSLQRYAPRPASA